MIKVFAEVGKLDNDSVGITLDVDGIKNVDEVLKLAQARLSAGKQITVWDVLAVMFFINRENRKEIK